MLTADDAPRRAGGAAAHAAEAGRRDPRDRGVHGQRPGSARAAECDGDGNDTRRRASRAQGQTPAGRGFRDRNAAPAPVSRTFPAGSYIVRMDQPHSRIADSLMDYRLSPNDPQKTPHDDTGWTFPELLQRAGDPRHRREGARRAGREDDRHDPREGRRDEHRFRVCGEPPTPTSRWSRCAKVRTRRSAAEEPPDAAGKKFNQARSSRTPTATTSPRRRRISGCRSAMSAAPSVKTTRFARRAWRFFTPG